jgi:hypothetical protein
MNVVKKLLLRMNGLHFRQEYLCLAEEFFEHRLYFNLFHDDNFICDITHQHILSGYSPLLFSFWSVNDQKWKSTIEIRVSGSALTQNASLPRKDAIAFLELKKIAEHRLNNTRFGHYEGTKGFHRFIGPLYRKVNEVINNKFNKKPANVFLDTALYRQVQVAYAIPRKISLVSVASNDNYNLFPTDLHGPAGTEFYIDSLRANGMACSQVLQTGKILISEMESTAYKMVYSLGKNHMQPLKPATFFPFSDARSDKFALPIPLGATVYRELELADSFKKGIHQVMAFRTVSMVQKPAIHGTLAHIHNFYATWRYNQGLKGNYLLR